MVFADTFFYTIEKVVLYLQLTNPKVVSLTWPALLKHFKAYSLQDWGWISLSREWRLSCAPLLEVKLSVELLKYPRKKGCAQKSDNRERQSYTLFSITSTRVHEVSSH